jgi:hypothetical protein
MINPAYAQTLRDLLQTQQVAALGTLHQGQPYASMAPFAQQNNRGQTTVSGSMTVCKGRSLCENPPKFPKLIAVASEGKC